ncbi:SWIM-type domain-containing protein [Trichonephila inaurata madagascariensis]|uniref:SWIM-type domain-containing protein n=1 Tax=Trichonephila inaurata madagascariensis TaxID=2747483 RepID=A0A8X6YAM2_9ARAC|nr:SWIM-type domain-containing protein [Trichonephila inaurata madagascariensis]
MSTLEFKNNVLKKAERSDSIGELVKDRILCEYDLIASEAKCHTLYYSNFLNQLPSTEKKPRQDHQVSEAMAEIFNYIENHDDSQFTLKELRDVLTGDLEEERLRIVEAAAAIIRENIQSPIVETKSYPPPSKMLIKENQEIPKGLLHFLQEVIIKNRKGKIANSKSKLTSISHTIMAALRERSFSSQLLLSLSVFLHRRYRSERLIDVLNSLGFAASYVKTVRYEISTAYHPQPRFLLSESGTLVQYVGDNVSISVRTLYGNNTLHIMGMIKIVVPKDIY